MGTFTDDLITIDSPFLFDTCLLFSSIPLRRGPSTTDGCFCLIATTDVAAALGPSAIFALKSDIAVERGITNRFNRGWWQL
jgi:hypothetical protein